MDSNEPPRSAPPRPVPDNEDTRARICEATIKLVGETGILNHDAVAERAGVSRRTVYRYYPDQPSLLRGARDYVTTLAGPGVSFPETEGDLVDQLEAIHTGFDRIAPTIILLRSTPQGRAIRLADRDERRARYTAAAADAVAALPPTDRPLATAMLQFLHTSAWLEMHDQWGLTGEEIAKSCRWAMKTLLKDLHDRKGKPLEED